MEILTSLFGDPVPNAVKLILLTLVLVAILLLIFWVFRKFVGSPAIKAARGRQPRLAVTDAANLDDKRRLVLVRRDDVEHLVMIGGATDVLVESNIVRVTQTRPAVLQNQTPVEPDTSIKDETSDQNQLAQGVAAAGTIAAAAVASTAQSDEPAPDLPAADEPAVEKEITTVEDIKEAAMADISLDLDDLEITDASPQTPEPTNDIPAQTPEPEITPPSTQVPESAAQTEPVEIEPVEIEPGALSSLEDALGEELFDDNADAAQPLEAPEVSAPSTPEEATAEPVANVQDETKPDDEKPDMEDEMQKLLDELSGEKA